jgi:hypothetical protein
LKLINIKCHAGEYLMKCFIPVFLSLCLFMSGAWSLDKDVLVPAIEGPWWSVAHNPDVGEYTRMDRQEPVDFAVWQAGDGTWQLWSCIRGTYAAGKGKKGGSRLFHRWEGKSLTSPDWKPMGVTWRGNPKLGEMLGGMQAPHVVKVGDTWHMFYGTWYEIAHAVSKDGKNFEKVIQPGGQTGMFYEYDKRTNTRDIMMLKVADLWYGYYTACPNDQGPVYCRTTRDFKTWSLSTTVAFGGQSGTGRGSSECPHVVNIGENDFYLFKTQTYGRYDRKNRKIRERGKPRTSVYYANDPLMFGINQDEKHFVCKLQAAAPEIVYYKGQHYIFALHEDQLDGIRAAKLNWVKQAK